MTGRLLGELIWLSDEEGAPVDLGPPYGPAHLLPDVMPPNQQPFETGMAFAASDILPVPLAQIMDPWETPRRFLPWLAAHESVDLWFDDWPDDRKRRMIAEALELAGLKGTHVGAVRHLGFVDAEVIDTVSYPARFVFGRTAIGISPIAHPPFKARHLVKVFLKRPVNAFEMGRSAIGRASLRAVDREPIRRAKLALSIAKAPETEYVVSFAWRRPATFRDEVPLFREITVGGNYDQMRL